MFRRQKNKMNSDVTGDNLLAANFYRFSNRDLNNKGRINTSYVRYVRLNWRGNFFFRFTNTER